jgi:anti-sigma factor RsiW
MTTPSFRDVEKLSASLDGKLSQAEQTRLEARLRSHPALGDALAELRQARAILRRTPKRRIPHNFTLTPTMAGIRPPLPRAVPALSWASAVAMLLFIFTLGTNLLGQLSPGAAAPAMSAAPLSSEGYGMGGGPSATQPPALDNQQATPTPEVSLMMAPQATASDQSRTLAPAASKSTPKPVDPWLYVWPGLALVLIAAAVLIRQASVLAFKRKVSQKDKP